MYSIKEIDPKTIKKAKVRNQKEIIKVRGKKFDPLRAFKVFESETEGFTKDLDIAHKVNKQFEEFLRREGLWDQKETSQKDEDEQIWLDNERIKMELALIEIEVELNSKK